MEPDAAVQPDPGPGLDDAPVALRADGRTVPSFPSRWVPVATSARPRLAWVVPTSHPGRAQRAYQLRLRRVGARPEDVVVDTGALDGADPWHQLVEPLEAHTGYRWQVRVRDDTGGWSGWSADAAVEIGPTALADWGARWVEAPALSTVLIPFDLDQDAVRGRLHLAAQGLARVCLDGRPVNPDALDPSRTDLTRALYRSYDVTDLCTAGGHLLELTVAHGAWAGSGAPPRVLAGCRIELPDGTVRQVGTRAGQVTRASTVAVEEPFYLERHELSRADQDGPTGVTVACGEPSRVANGPSDDDHPKAPPASLEPDPSPPLTVVQERSPDLLHQTGGRRVYDVGTNVAGRARLRVRGRAPAGACVRVVHGEHLGPDGGVDTTNLTLPHDRGRTRQVVEFVLAGAGGEILEAWFCYAGFRYLEVTGLPDEVEVEVTARTLHTDLPAAGTLETDSALVDRLVGHGRRTLLNNVHGLPEDCPTREQAGWTGDTASVTEFELAAFDVEGFFAKWLGDLATSQQEDGAIPAISPSVPPASTPPDPVWGAALQRALLGHWLHYGDRRVLEEHLPVLRRWTDWLQGCIGPHGVVDGAPISYGHDWLGLQQTPPELHHTAAAIDAFEVWSRLEVEVGDGAASAAASQVAQQLRAAARARFVDLDRRVVGNGSQGCWAIALEAGLLGPEERPWAERALVSAVRRRGNRVSSGFATTRTVVRALAAAGHDQVLADVLEQTAEPGVGAMLASDMGTFWECWWIDPTNTGTGSLDHVGLGGPFAGWVWWRLAGLQPLSAGYATFRVDPQPVQGVDRLRLSTRTVRGEVGIDWRRDGSDIELDLTVPVSATAVVPTGTGDVELGAGCHRLRLPRPPAPRHQPPARPVPPPSWAERSADVDLDPVLDTRAAARVGVIGGAVAVLPDGLRCMPVPHEQEAGPVLRLLGAAGVEEVLGRLELDLDLTDARFGYARLDLCGCPVPGPVETVLRVHSADGSVRTASGRVWPAGWNRVTVPLADWPGRSEVVAVEAGVRLKDGGTAGDEALTVHLGPVGFSRVRPTW